MRIPIKISALRTILTQFKLPVSKSLRLKSIPLGIIFCTSIAHIGSIQASTNHTTMECNTLQPNIDMLVLDEADYYCATTTSHRRNLRNTNYAEITQTVARPLSVTIRPNRPLYKGQARLMVPYKKKRCRWSWHGKRCRYTYRYHIEADNHSTSWGHTPYQFPNSWQHRH